MSIFGEYAAPTGRCGATVTKRRTFQIKLRQIDATGADMAVTSCANCRQTFDDGQAHFRWARSMGSLLELVADRLAG